MNRAVSAISAVSASQVITAGGSLILQVIAARELGLRGFGAFTLALALLTAATALYTGYVGDALTVLDRHDRPTRSALAFAAVLAIAVAFVAAFGLVLALHIGSIRDAVIFAGLVAGWLIEETGRRLLMARLEFWGLVVNDAIYMGVTLVGVLAGALSGARITLGLLFAAMGIGALAAIGAARVQLPRAEFTQLRPRRITGAEVHHFARWRSLQAALRPSELFVARVLIQQLAGLAAVGVVEAGRLVVAPIQTVLGAVSALLLSTGAEDERGGRPDPRRNQRVAGVLVAFTVAAGGLAALLSNPLGRLLARHSISHLLVLGWTAYLATWAAALPFTAELTVRRLSWPVFVARLVETAGALATVAAVLASGAGAQWVPWVLAAGALANTGYLRRLAVRTRPARLIIEAP